MKTWQGAMGRKITQSRLSSDLGLMSPLDFSSMHVFPGPCNNSQPFNGGICHLQARAPDRAVKLLD